MRTIWNMKCYCSRSFLDQINNMQISYQSDASYCVCYVTLNVVVTKTKTMTQRLWGTINTGERWCSWLVYQWQWISTDQDKKGKEFIVLHLRVSIYCRSHSTYYTSYIAFYISYYRKINLHWIWITWNKKKYLTASLHMTSAQR